MGITQNTQINLEKFGSKKSPSRHGTMDLLIQCLRCKPGGHRGRKYDHPICNRSMIIKLKMQLLFLNTQFCDDINPIRGQPVTCSGNYSEVIYSLVLLHIIDICIFFIYAHILDLQTKLEKYTLSYLLELIIFRNKLNIQIVATTHEFLQKF